VNDFAHHPLDSVIDALDTYLPLAEIRGDSDVMMDAATVVSPKDKEELTSVGKIGAIGAHLGQVGLVKLREFQLRGPVHLLVASQMWELVSYSAATLHLETMGDRAAAKIADAQHVLFAQAANAATNMQSFVEQRPMLLAVEKTLEPYALTTKSYAEATAIRIIAAVHAGTELTSHFFANRAADVQDVSLRATRYATELVKQFREQHPDWESRASELLTSVRDAFARTSDLIQRITGIPLDQFHTAFTSIYQVLYQLQHSVIAFRDQLLVSAKKDQGQQEILLLDVHDLGLPSAPPAQQVQLVQQQQVQPQQVQQQQQQQQRPLSPPQQQQQQPQQHHHHHHQQQQAGEEQKPADPLAAPPAAEHHHHHHEQQQAVEEQKLIDPTAAEQPAEHHHHHHHEEEKKQEEQPQQQQQQQHPHGGHGKHHNKGKKH